MECFNKVPMSLNDLKFRDRLSLNFKSFKSLVRDRESVRAFYNNVYFVYLPVYSLRLSHTSFYLGYNPKKQNPEKKCSLL